MNPPGLPGAAPARFGRGPWAPPTDGFARVAASVARSSGWRRTVLAFAAGAVGALALPPFSFFPAMIAPMTVAVWLIDGSGATRSAFADGWRLGFGYFVAGLWWLGAAFLVDADRFAWALPLGVVALPAGLALFWGLGFALARLLWSGGALRVFALAFGLGVAEWARGLVLTGFPWNDVGMAMGANLHLAQIASLVGLHGLSFLSIALFAAPATLAAPAPGWKPGAPALFALATLALIAAFGFLRLSAPPSPLVPGVAIRLVQANVSQGEFFSPENEDAIVSRYLDLSARDIPGGRPAREVTHLVWPESAFPFILSRNPAALTEIQESLREGQTLITGAARMEAAKGGAPKYFNAILIVSPAGLSGEHYDKRHLVPFGEYLPFASLWEKTGITQFVHAPGGFSAGETPRALSVPGLPDGRPLICYEAIFPDETGELASDSRRPAFLLNVTDDAWFGATAGPYQHFAQARLRAIELGLPLVRAANTGISAVVDGFGREIASAPLGVEAVVDAGLPEPLSPTEQARFGSIGAVLFAMLFLSVALIGVGSRLQNFRLW